MSKRDEILKYRERSEEEMRNALNRFCDIAWSGRSVFSIPADERHDADIILMDAINELLARRKDSADE